MLSTLILRIFRQRKKPKCDSPESILIYCKISSVLNLGDLEKVLFSLPKPTIPRVSPRILAQP